MGHCPKCMHALRVRIGPQGLVTGSLNVSVPDPLNLFLSEDLKNLD